MWAGPATGRGEDGIKANWTERLPLPVGMAEVGVAAVGDKVYVVGGTEQLENGPPRWASTLNMMYDPKRNTWQARAPLPQGLSHVGVAALGGKLYAFGGFTDIVHMGARNSAFAYDPRTNTWSSLPPLSSARGSVAVAAVGGKLHVFGGRGADKIIELPSPPGAPKRFAAFGTVATHEVYDPARRRWSKAAPLPGPARDHVGIAVLNGRIHLFGGRVADVQDNLDRHDVFDPRTGGWSTAAPLPRPRSAGAATALNGRIIYAGGECKPGGRPSTANAYDDVTAYDPKTDRWTTLASLPQARHGFGAGTVRNISYFVAGAKLCGGGSSADTLALRFGKTGG